MNYLVNLIYDSGITTRRYSTLARASQEAKTAVAYPDGPYRAAVYDRNYRLIWTCHRQVETA